MVRKKRTKMEKHIDNAVGTKLVVERQGDFVIRYEFDDKRLWSDLKDYCRQIPFFHVSDEDVAYAFGAIDNFIKKHYADRPHILNAYLSAEDKIPEELKNPEIFPSIIPKDLKKAWDIATMINQNQRSQSYKSYVELPGMPELTMKMFFGLKVTGPFSSKPNSYSIVNLSGKISDIDKFLNIYAVK